ncbi:dihydroneopterin aldolase [Sediminitomix flava]|uniref:7,8-dihydroneopterin aldolase n=1 Tax=Sediminitomix flava TaxID=379075 RepID=A0A315ZG43_SEDFL|nr:dihydroneopterin aldolase [Sediminitomix flava]PWJ43828.1 dihydroneopterin aldolase [Sediminitomix flava]
MDKIALEGMEFFAYHGFYEEEQKIGNKYGVDIEVKTNLEKAADEDNLAETVNYESLYQIVSSEMKIQSKLLEHIAGRIIKTVFEKHSDVESILVKIKKFNPPIGGVCYASVITMERNRS